MGAEAWVTCSAACSAAVAKAVEAVAASRTCWAGSWAEAALPEGRSGGMNTGAIIAGLAPVVIGMLKSGGLQKMMSGFADKGMAEQADSWVSTGDNKPVSGSDMKVALGEEEVKQVAQNAGISEDEAADVLAKVVPEVVNGLTPNGQVPADADLEKLLSQLQPAQT